MGIAYVMTCSYFCIETKMFLIKPFSFFISIYHYNSDQYICWPVYQGFQGRFTGEVDFYRGWNDYKNGFGSVFREYWWGECH